MAGLTQRLGKLTIKIDEAVSGVAVPGFEKGILEVPFNPTELSSERNTSYAEVAIPGLDAPVLQWVRGDGETVSFELFFDVTDNMVEGLIFDGQDVRQKWIRPLEHLMIQDPKLHAPPRVSLRWGPHIVLRRGFVKGLSVTYKLFDGLGRPARATARLTVRQAIPGEEQLADVGKNSPDLRGVAVVKEGDTLPLLAHRLYRDATKWRAIAEANRITNPLALV
ncbi:MAG: LysM peptidoglycan-binding domain-containing protein, partial [Myxococcales bacterium]|nr:LysM peptidoglycan-binding domain-containing protein [Myxococcales bacterium]